MYTGLIQTMGRVAGLESTADGARIRIETEGWDHQPSPGDSISISGCCLTVVGTPERSDGKMVMAFDAIPETLAKTTLGDLAAGSRVNIESCCTPTTLLGGHVVQGHIEGVGEVAAVRTEPGYEIEIRPPAALMPCITPKGSIAIDGISLTISAVDVGAGTFCVALIPTTLSATTMGQLGVGSRVNLETDILARTMVHWARHYSGED